MREFFQIFGLPVTPEKTRFNVFRILEKGFQKKKEIFKWIQL